MGRNDSEDSIESNGKQQRVEKDDPRCGQPSHRGSPKTSRHKSRTATDADKLPARPAPHTNRSGRLVGNCRGTLCSLKTPPTSPSVFPRCTAQSSADGEQPARDINTPTHELKAAAGVATMVRLRFDGHSMATRVRLLIKVH